MPHSTIISATDLASRVVSCGWVLIDCRFSLKDVDKGRNAYLASHIPGAVYAHLDDDLSGPVIKGRTGRHPLPSVAEFVNTLSAWGIEAGVQVVAYDDTGGSIAARLWWMLRWLGHEDITVLDGGWQAWTSAEYPVRSGAESRSRKEFEARPRPELVADAVEVERIRNDDSYVLCDCRGADRFRGENETMDPVAGHIPGAISLPYAGNLSEDNTFRPAAELRQRFEKSLGGTPSENVVLYCGSGVTAAHNVLAMAYAGLGDARLYPGSWSEWITDPGRPVGTGGLEG